jgi:predicted nuclease of predicted toxin-antitoxin system
MSSLASQLRPIAASLTTAPRVYVDANLPWGAVAFMRQTLRWDVLFVLEEADLRRASDREHFRRALDLGRTLITLDRDFLDERRFPLLDSPGVVICSAPDEPRLRRVLQYLDRAVLRAGAELPLRGRALEIAPDVAAASPASRRRRRRKRTPRRHVDT